jgi:hypothetical protein
LINKVQKPINTAWWDNMNDSQGHSCFHLRSWNSEQSQISSP